jgi:hypothetical protein
MNAVLMVVTVALSDAIGDLWRLLRGGPVGLRRLIGRLIGQTCFRALAVTAWLATTAVLAELRASSDLRPEKLIPLLAAGLSPLLLSGIELAPHIGPLLYLGLHAWVIVRLISRLQELSGLPAVDSTFAVLSGAVGYWLVRTLPSVLYRRRSVHAPAIAEGLS